MRQPAARARLPATPATPALPLGVLGVLALLPLLALLGACGGRDAGLRVEVRTFAADGPPPREGLRLQHVQGGRAVGPALPLQPVEGRPGLYAVPATPTGHYELLAPAGWGTLAGGLLPQLVPGASPAQYMLVRQHTLVVASEDARRVLGAGWALEHTPGPAAPGSALAGEPTRAVRLGVEQDAGGAVLLRVPPEAWGGPVALQGRFEDGGLTVAWRGALPAGGAPLYLPLAPCEVRTLALVVEGSAGAGQASAAGAQEAVAWVEGLPLAVERRAPLDAGRARLEGLPLGGARLRLGVTAAGGDPGAGGPEACVVLAAEAWEGLHEVRLLHPALQGPGACMLRLEGVASGAGLCVQVRPEGSEGYGVACLQPSPDGVPRLRLQAGRHRVLVQGPAGVQETVVEVPQGLEALPVTLPAAQEAAQVSGTVFAPAGSEVRWLRVEDGRLHALHGGALRTRPGGRYEASLPPGTWQVEARSPEGATLPARRVVLSAGLRLALSLQR